MLNIINYNSNPKVNLINATYPTAIQKIDNLTSLRTYEPAFDKQVIFLLGKTVVGINSSNYRSDFSDTSSTDNNDTVIVTIGGKRWKKIIISGSGGGSGGLLSTNNLSDVTSISASRSNLGLDIGTDVQAYSSILQATTASFTTALATTIGTNTSDIAGIKIKTDNLTVPSAVNTDTLKSDITSAKTKTDNITINSPVNLNTINTKSAITPTSDITGITGADAITNIISLTQAEYDAIESKSSTTFYIIVG